jgi:DNA repair protein RadD
MFKLRDYQQEAVDSTIRYFIKHGDKSGNPLIQLPTGTGKSLVIAGLLKFINENWGSVRSMVVTHVKELIEQNHDKFQKLWPGAPAGIYSAGIGRKDVNAMITFAGIQSVAKKAEAFKDVDIIIVDECDLISPNQQTSYQKFFAEIRKHNPHLKVIGLTATGWRLGYGSIVKDDDAPNAMFDEIVFDACTMECFNWFINEGYLLPVVPKATKKELDVSGVHKRGGEFIESELQKVVNNPEVTEYLVEDAINIAREDNRESWLIFGSGVEHCKDIIRVLKMHGVSCAMVTGDTPKKERDTIINDFKSGRITAVVNNNVLTTGFDHPGLDLIVVLRPSESSRLWVQILGRGTRPDYADGFDLSTTAGRLQAIAASHKQNCLVLDYSGNTRRLGPINDPVMPKRPGQKGKSTAPVKMCPTCSSWNHASVRYCGGLPPIDTTGMTFGEVNELILRGYFVRGKNGIATAKDFCGHEFTFEKKLMASASTKQIIKNDLPVTEVFRVSLVSYYAHYNRGDASKPPTLRVDYHVDGNNGRAISQWICLLHDGFAGNKARRWWREHTTMPVPTSIDHALEVVAQLKVPTHIYVDMSKKFPDVLNACYDGTAFGKEAKSEHVPEVQVVAEINVFKSAGTYTNKYDEDDEPAKPTSLQFNANTHMLNGKGEPVPMDFDDDIPF